MRAIGFEGKLLDAEHQVELLKESLAVIDVGRRGLRSDGLRTRFPLASCLQSLLYSPH